MSSSIKTNLDQAEWLVQKLPIRLFGDPLLTKRCNPVAHSEIKSGQARKWANELINFLNLYRKKTGAGRGLAANQLGINKRIILVWLDDGPQIYINPKIISKVGQGVYPESCISAASLILGDVIRPWTIEIKFLDLDGKEHQLKADPMHSRLLLHEIDHLEGVICADKYEPGSIRIAGGGAKEILKPELKIIK